MKLSSNIAPRWTIEQDKGLSDRKERLLIMIRQITSVIRMLALTIGLLSVLSGCGTSKNRSADDVKGEIGVEEQFAILSKTDENLNAMRKAQRGDVIIFGSYEQDNDTENGKEPIEWIVLSNDGNDLFVLSKYALDCKPYHREQREVIWEECTLEKWLNSDFYNEAFSDTDKKMIKRTKLKNSDVWTRIFLLSVEDVVKTSYGFSNDYDEHDIMRRCAPTAYAKSQGVWTYDLDYDAEEWKQCPTSEGEPTCWWWLRSQGSFPLYAAYVSLPGNVFAEGDPFVDDRFAVRPALVIDLNGEDQKATDNYLSSSTTSTSSSEELVWTKKDIEQAKKAVRYLYSDAFWDWGTYELYGFEFDHFGSDGGSWYAIKTNPGIAELKEALIKNAQEFVTGDMADNCLRGINEAFESDNWMHFERVDGKTYYVSYPGGDSSTERWRFNIENGEYVATYSFADAGFLSDEEVFFREVHVVPDEKAFFKRVNGKLLLYKVEDVGFITEND